MKLEQNAVKQTEGAVADDDTDFEPDFLIPAIQSKNPSIASQKQQLDKQKLVMALSENVFNCKSSFLYKQLWKCDQNHKLDEINLYLKKVQFAQSILQESQRDLIIGSALCAFAVVVVYYLTTIQVYFGDVFSFFGGTENSESPWSKYGLLAGKTIGYSGVLNLFLLMVRIKQMCLFEVNEYNEDLKFNLRRSKANIKNNPYVNDYLRKLHDPENGIGYIKCLLSLMTTYLLLSLMYHFIEGCVYFINWSN